MTSAILPSTYDTALVLLSMAIAALAAFVSLDVAARIWPARGWRRACWIAASATAMGGGIWAMHFIAMLAFSLPSAIAFDVPTTALSLGIAIAAAALGFGIIAFNHDWRRLAFAGIAMGLGIAAMHYAGMSAMLVQAEPVYSPGVFALSVLIACVAATAALWIALNVSGLAWQCAAAVIMGAAVSGMHYTGMAAVCFHATPAPLAFEPGQIERGSLAWAIAMGTLLILGIEIASAGLDRRFSALRIREAKLLRLTARRFENLVASSNDLIAVVDATGKIDFIASSGRTAIGLAAREIEGHNIFEFVQGHGTATLRSLLARSGEQTGFFIIDGLEIRDRGGLVRRFEATLRDLTKEESVGGFVLTFHEVTEREKAASELRRAKRVADEANRMKSEFIANMSHELRTPLNAILGFSEIIATDTVGRFDLETCRDFCSDIHKSASHLLAIISDILALSTTETNKAALDESLAAPEAVIAETLKLVEAQAGEKRIRISVHVAPDLPTIQVDIGKMRQALYNLISNAIRFSESGGAVSAHAALLSSGELEFTIEDSGIGIPQDKLERVAEPFYQVDGSITRDQDGTGLGLTITRSVIEQHGGLLILSSSLGQGTKARLILPASRLMTGNTKHEAA